MVLKILMHCSIGHFSRTLILTKYFHTVVNNGIFIICQTSENERRMI